MISVENIKQLLSQAVKNEASDIHLSQGYPPIVRIDGKLLPIKGKVLSRQDLEDIIVQILDDYQMELVTGDYYETSGYFLLNVTDINQETSEYCDLYDEFKCEKYKIMMVGEFSDGQIDVRNKEHYIIFRVEEV